MDEFPKVLGQICHSKLTDLCCCFSYGLMKQESSRRVDVGVGEKNSGESLFVTHDGRVLHTNYSM